MDLILLFMYNIRRSLIFVRPFSLDVFFFFYKNKENTNKENNLNVDSAPSIDTFHRHGSKSAIQIECVLFAEEKQKLNSK